MRLYTNLSCVVTSSRLNIYCRLIAVGALPTKLTVNQVITDRLGMILSATIAGYRD